MGVKIWLQCGWLFDVHVGGSSHVSWYPQSSDQDGSESDINIYNGGFGFSVVRIGTIADGLVHVMVHGRSIAVSDSAGNMIAIGFDRIYYINSSSVCVLDVTSPTENCLCARPHVVAPHVCESTIRSAAAGDSHLVVVNCDDGKVFQCRDVYNRAVMEPVDGGVCGVVQVSCGSHHTVALSSDGRVWTWGNSLRGECGRGLRQGDPGVVDFGPVTMVHVAAGGSHTLCCSETGDVYSWGTNSEGALGLVEVTSVYEPKLIEFFGVDGVDAVKVAAGSNHSLVLTGQGDVYAFGSNMFGQLGVGPGIEKASWPIRVCIKKICCDIAAGWWHSVFVTEKDSCI